MLENLHSKGSKTGRAVKVNRRNCTTKSRSGCVTCKAKHLKCDEAKPECFNCRGKGVKCGGYGRKLQWSMKHQVRWIEIARRRKKSWTLGVRGTTDIFWLDRNSSATNQTIN
ncbi:hypothetical protein V2G26_012956 [Clonostachys chloroleuca]